MARPLRQLGKPEVSAGQPGPEPAAAGAGLCGHLLSPPHGPQHPAGRDHGGVPFVINQNRYSIFDRTIEQNGLKETANRLGKGIIAFSPLAQGLLTNRYLNGIPADSRVRTDGRFLKESAFTEEKLAQIRALNEIAAARGQTLAEMALAWILKDGQVTSVLIGASRPEQILDNIKALDNTTFTAEELEAIDRASGAAK